MRKVRKDFYILFGICLVLLVLSIFFDYTISAVLYNRTSILSKAIHVVAQVPTYVLLSFFCLGMFNTRKRDGSTSSMLSFVFGILGAGLFGFLAGYVFLYNMNLYSITIIIACDIGIFVLCYVITKLICDHDAKNLRKYSKVGLLSFFGCIFIAFIILTFFNRVSFRRIDGMVNIYIPWYKIRFLPDISGYLHRSFPSINVLMASFMLYINIFNHFSRLFNKRKMITLIISYSWIFVVSISQLILGYAYMSDIALSLILEMVVSIGVYLIIYRKKASD